MKPKIYTQTIAVTSITPDIVWPLVTSFGPAGASGSTIVKFSTDIWLRGLTLSVAQQFENVGGVTAGFVNAANTPVDLNQLSNIYLSIVNNILAASSATVSINRTVGVVFEEQDKILIPANQLFGMYFGGSFSTFSASLTIYYQV